MKQALELVVRDHDEATAFHVGGLGFRLVEDTDIPEEGKRWVVSGPAGAEGSRILLARASTSGQLARVGDHAGGRVAVFRDLYGNLWDLVPRNDGTA